MMANCVVSWASRRQPTVSLSSTEAEYKAASDTCRQLAWLRNFGGELGDNMTAPTPLCLDNQGSIFLAVNPAVDRRTKHIEIRYHFIREFYESGETGPDLDLDLDLEWGPGLMRMCMYVCMRV